MSLKWADTQGIHITLKNMKTEQSKITKTPCIPLSSSTSSFIWSNQFLFKI